MSKIKKIALFILITFCLLNYLAFCVEDIPQQHNLITILLQTPVNNQVKVLEQNIFLVNKNFLDLCEERSKFALSRKDYEQAYQLALIADIAAKKIDQKDNYRLGLAFLYFRQGDLQKALKLCEEVLSEKPKQALAHHICGLIYYASKNLSSAEKEFNLAIQLDPSDSEFHYRLSLVYISQKKTQQAMSELEKTLQSYPEHPEAKILYQRLKLSPQTTEVPVIPTTQQDSEFAQIEQYIANNQEDLAVKELEKLLILQPSNPKIYLYLGKIKAKQEDLKSALIYLEKAKDLQPDNASVCYYLGYVYEHLYDSLKNPLYLDQALGSYEKSVNLSPEYNFASFDATRVKNKKQKYLEEQTKKPEAPKGQGKQDKNINPKP